MNDPFPNPRARYALLWPATVLQVCALGGIAMTTATLLFTVPSPGTSREAVAAGSVMICGAAIFMMIGAELMWRLKNFELSVLTAFSGLVPFLHNSLIFGSVAAFWSLVLLWRKPNRAAFELSAEERAALPYPGPLYRLGVLLLIATVISTVLGSLALLIGMI